jgi:hypothetical protein
MPRLTIFISIAVLAISAISGAQSIWKVDQRNAAFGAQSNPVLPWLASFTSFKVDPIALRAELASMVTQRFPGDRIGARNFDIPMPDGTIQQFRVVNSPIMTPALQRVIPVQTYAGYGLNDRYAHIRFDLGPNGFHGYVMSPEGDVVIEPMRQGDQNGVISYYRRDNLEPSSFTCSTRDGRSSMGGDGGSQIQFASNLKTYRLAMNATGEYTSFFGGVANATNAVVTSVNRVVGVYEIDFAISMTLVYNKCWPDGATDPFTNNSGGTMLGQNQTNLDTVVGNANYDIGHVFSTGGGGVAGLRVVGVTGQKSRGVTGLPAPVGDNFDIDYVAHEMGHQYGGNHTFNGTTSSCGGGNRVASAAYEPGSGSTIMAYAGICGAENLQAHSDAYFHTKSYDEIIAWRNNAGSGGTTTSIPNSPPTADAGPDFAIPLNTPFKLTAGGTDPDNDPLTYCWEQFNLGQQGPGINTATSPLFRSKNPLTTGTRFMPALATVLANATDQWERIPDQARNLTFRCTVRDNKPGGGGSNYDSVIVAAAGTTFSVTSPNTAVTWAGGSTQTVTWNVGGGSVSANVNIVLSTNGGTSYGTGGATIVLANTPNDGSETITVPNVSTTQARIFVEASNGTFYDVSNQNFTITLSNFITVDPNAIAVLQGVLLSGGVPEISSSNNEYVSVNLQKTARAQPTITQIEGTSSMASASRIDVTVEANGSIPGMTQVVSAWDFVSGAWVQIDTSTANTTDATRVIPITTNPSRYIETGTGKVRIKIEQDIAARGITTNIDQVQWKITQ